MSVNDRARTMLYPDTQLHDRPAHGEAERVAPPTAEDIDRDITAARRVLALEASGINALADGLDDSFSRAVAILHRCSGRVVVSGMGKSGLIGRKIAATMASTGTPAFFVHPGEASHGDLGMITVSDVVVAMSNSGETAELADIVAYTRRFSIPLIAITGGANSMLATAADVTLLLPSTPEACPLGLAPTTSTTATMALGDALAVALLERRGFSSDDFQVLHPGGRLGSRLIKVADIMHASDKVPLVAMDTPMSDTLIEMTSKSFGCVGVVNDTGELVGVVTDGDLRRHMQADLLGKSAQDVMTASPKTIRPGALAAEALQLMNAHAITSLFVLDADKQPIGILHVHDCLRAGVA